MDSRECREEGQTMIDPTNQQQVCGGDPTLIPSHQPAQPDQPTPPLTRLITACPCKYSRVSVVCPVQLCVPALKYSRPPFSPKCQLGAVVCWVGVWFEDTNHLLLCVQSRGGKGLKALLTMSTGFEEYISVWTSYGSLFGHLHPPSAFSKIGTADALTLQTPSYVRSIVPLY